MTIDKLGFYQGALRLLGERKLSGLTEARGPRYILDDIWAEDPIRACLEAGEWAFATRTVQMLADDGIAPDFGYEFGYEKPDDWVRSVSVSLDPYFKIPLKEHRDEGGFLFLDNPDVYFSYVSDDIQYGKNYALYPASFTNYVMSYMAKKIHPTVDDSASSIEELDHQMDRFLSNAQGKNGLTRPTHDQPRGGWVTSRGARRDDRRSDR